MALEDDAAPADPPRDGQVRQISVASVTNGVRNNVALNRFELDLEDGIAFAIYRMSPGTATIVHTEVPPKTRGSGVGSTFVRRILQEVRRQGLKVIPQCDFVR